MNISITDDGLETRTGYLCSGSGGPTGPHAPTKPPAPQPEPEDDGDETEEQDEDTQ